MSSMMRTKINMVHEFELGMTSATDLKHKARRRTTFFRPAQLVATRVLYQG